MAVIDRLNAKKDELEERLAGQNRQLGSQRKESLEYKIKKIAELITAYQSTSAPTNLSEAEKILNQQVGFAEQKEKILNILKVESYCQQRNVKKEPLILCLVGPLGVGKTTFGQILARALKKEFFAVALGGMSDSTLLVGAKESSSGNEIGELTKALVETKSHDPLILLDEIDKVGTYGGNSVIHGCLNSVLDPVQNREILDYYLDIKLDFSQATFIVTANEPKKIPSYLLSRMLIVELTGYNLEQKKAIANQFIQRWFDQNSSLNQNNFEITSEVLEILINKTKEEGVRQLKSALDGVFDYCLLQWAEETNQGKSESKIKIDSELVHKIITHDFPNIDLQNDTEDKNDKKQLEILRQELERLKGEKNDQVQLKAVKFNTLLVLRQFRGQLEEKEYQDYERKVNTANSQEEIEVIAKEFLLKIKQKNSFSKPVRGGKDKDKKIKDELTEIEQKNKDLEEQIKLSNAEMEKLKGEIENLQKQEKSRSIKDNALFIIVIVALIIWGVYGIFKLLILLKEQKKKKKQG